MEHNKIVFINGRIEKIDFDYEDQDKIEINNDFKPIIVSRFFCKNDIYYSTGGAPEGVVVAAALSCYGGQIQGRLVLDDEEKVRAKKLG